MGKSKSKGTKATKAKTSDKAFEPKPPKQTEIPGTERKRIPDVERAANLLREVRTERMELQKSEAELQEKLIAVMHEHKVTVYKFDGDEDELVITDLTKVSVRKADTARSEDE